LPRWAAERARDRAGTQKGAAVGLQAGAPLVIEVGERLTPARFGSTFSDVAPGELLAYIDARGALALAINVALNARLIPLWSIEGAAWATLGTELVLTAGCGVALWSMRAPAQAGRLVTEP